jgi:hypothetical protein
MKIIKFVKNNILVTAFISIIATIVLITFFMLFFDKSDQFIYARIKVSQGYWWATTTKPKNWYTKSIKKGLKQTNFLGNPTAEIVSVYYYPNQPNSFNTYLDVKLKANKEDNKYYFNRSQIGISSPIDLEFPGLNISGTIIQLSDSEFKNDDITKVIQLEKELASPWEYNQIQIGDSYSNGNTKVFEIKDKTIISNKPASLNSFGQIAVNKQHILVTAEIKLKKVKGNYIFGEEQIVRLNQPLEIATSNFYFDNYVITSLSDVKKN